MIKRFKDFIREDLPTNNAGSGHIDGIGVGPRGEPGVRTTKYTFKRKKKVK